jgi:hypothetical protein
MSTLTTPKAATAAAARPTRSAATPAAADVGREAKRLAAAVLEVLAGARTPAEAATALGLSLPRYYQVETRAVRGLVAACEARPRGRAPDVAKELAALRQHNQRLQREVGRQQALVRASQRTVGLAAPAAPAKSPGKKPRRRRTARALRVAAQLQTEAAAAEPTAAGADNPR